jgi:hypothetical protein
MFEAIAIIHSLQKNGTNPATDTVTIIHENNNNDVVAEYKSIRYTAIFNPFVCCYYVDDVYGLLPDQRLCPACGEVLYGRD